MTHIIKSVVSFGLISALLAGCNTFSSSDSACMKTSLVTTLSKMPLSRALRGDTRDITLTNFKAGCGGSSPELPGGSGEIGISMAFIAPPAKHSSNRISKVTFPLFVALVDSNENVIDRQDENVDVKISDKSLNFAHRIIYTPPKDIDINSENHRILVGFNESRSPVVSSSETLKKSVSHTPSKKKKRKK